MIIITSNLPVATRDSWANKYGGKKGAISMHVEIVCFIASSKWREFGRDTAYVVCIYQNHLVSLDGIVLMFSQ